MLTERRGYDPESRQLPQAVEHELSKRKLLNQRGRVMEFRHAKVMAYLAFLYFRDRWRRILTLADTVADSNWNSMLQFYFFHEQNSVEAKAVFFLLLEKDMETAKRNFIWLQANRPELSRDWNEAFSRRVGEKELGLI